MLALHTFQDICLRTMISYSIFYVSFLHQHTISPQVSLDPLPDVVPGNKPIQGLWSIVDDLTGFQLILDSMWGQNSDFKTNLSNYFSTLREYLKQKRVSLKCPARTPNSFKDLQDYLKENKKFNLSLVPRLLQRFNHYLNRCLSANVEAC